MLYNLTNLSTLKILKKIFFNAFCYEAPSPQVQLFSNSELVDSDYYEFNCLEKEKYEPTADEKEFFGIFEKRLTEIPGIGFVVETQIYIYI